MDTAQTNNPPSFETVWAALQETGRLIKEMREDKKDTDRVIEEMREDRKKTDRMIEEMRKEREEMREERKKTELQMKETDRQMRETDRQLGKLGRRFGEVIEYMVAPNLLEKFRELGLVFYKGNSGTNVEDHVNRIFFEIDILLENGDKALLVEVKSKLTTEDVKEHIERLEKMRKYADLHGDKRAFLGAVAGVVMTINVKEYALKQGFYVIEPSGETFNITSPDGQLKEW